MIFVIVVQLINAKTKGMMINNNKSKIVIIYNIIKNQMKI